MYDVQMFNLFFHRRCDIMTLNPFQEFFSFLISNIRYFANDDVRDEPFGENLAQHLPTIGMFFEQEIGKCWLRHGRPEGLEIPVIFRQGVHLLRSPGNKTVSLTFLLPVSTIVSRATPNPHPAWGGAPNLKPSM